MGASLLLVGGGRMGSALLTGWWSAGLVGRVVLIDPSSPMPGLPPVEQGKGPQDCPTDFKPDAVILAVKPQVAADALPAYRPFVRPETVFLSILAGKTLAWLEETLGAGAAIVRAMPNTPAAIGRGISVAVRNGAVSADQAALCDRLLQAAGEVAWVEEERLLDPVTALSGSGPAYVFLLAEAMAAAGVQAGLPPDLAARLARVTVAGSGELLHRSAEDPADLRRAVTSPGGTTQAALTVLMASDGLTPLMERAVAAGTARARELGS